MIVIWTITTEGVGDDTFTNFTYDDSNTKHWDRWDFILFAAGRRQECKYIYCAGDSDRLAEC